MSTVESPESARAIGQFLLSRENNIRRAIDRLDFDIEGFRSTRQDFVKSGTNSCSAPSVFSCSRERRPDPSARQIRIASTR